MLLMTKRTGGNPILAPEANQSQPLPASAQELCNASEIARFLTDRFLNQQPAVLLRYGDTGGRILARPKTATPEYAYLKRFLGSSVTPEQVNWLADRIEYSVIVADVIGLRSDLLGPNLPDDILSGPESEIPTRLSQLYPMRPVDQASLKPDGARRLGETRKAMEAFNLPKGALLTDAWIHVGLAEIGFFSALLRHAPSASICTSLISRKVLKHLAEALPNRLRTYECPAYPEQEREWGGDHSFLWDRWLALQDSLRPMYAGEPLLISAGIWTKVIAPEWARRGGIAIDMGSVMDYFNLSPTRPAVLKTRYDDPKKVPAELSIETQLKRTERIEDFLALQN